MKKIILSAICSFTLLSSITSAAQLQLASMPDGLKKGYFMMNGSYSRVSVPKNGGYFNSEGAVISPGIYGLAAQLVEINELLADPDTTDFKLFLRLSCRNNAIQTYQFNNEQLKSPTNITIQAPANCG